MAGTFEKQRQAALGAAQQMARLGLVAGSSGNVSVRLEDPSGEERYLITPAGLPYERMTAADLVLVNGELQRRDGTTNVIAEAISLLRVPRSLTAPPAHNFG